MRSKIRCCTTARRVLYGWYHHWPNDRYSVYLKLVWRSTCANLIPNTKMLKWFQFPLFLLTSSSPQSNNMYTFWRARGRVTFSITCPTAKCKKTNVFSNFQPMKRLKWTVSNRIGNFCSDFWLQELKCLQVDFYDDEMSIKWNVTKKLSSLYT